MVGSQDNSLRQRKNSFKKRKLIFKLSVFILIVISIFMGVKALSASVSATDKSMMKNAETNSEDENIVINNISKNGIETITGSILSSSSIRKIENLKFSTSSSGDDNLFVGEVTLSNGVCYQNAKLSGKISNTEDESFSLNNLYIEAEDKIYKENNIDENRIKNIIIDEIANGDSYIFNDLGKVLHYKIDKNMITEFNINMYIVREDNTIRAEIEGVALGEDKEAISFSGVVSISGKPAEGNVRNSRDIVINDIKKRML